MADPKQFARPIPQGLIARVVSGVKYAFTGKADFFPPMEPIEAAVLQPEEAGVTDRAWDYQAGLNLQIVPRQGEANSFTVLRNVADSLDILRLIIETCQDELTSFDWEIRPREVPKGQKKQGQKASASKLSELNDFYKTPDRRQSWDEWYRALLEDLFVIDAVTICPRMTKGGELYSLDLMDGSMIKPLIDVTGRRPMPPVPAYMHVLKGIPAVYYSADELIYAPRKRRTHRLYGYGPVEQTILSCNIALRRAVHKLQYYTEGNVPDLLIRVPEGWSPDQIRQFDLYFNSILQGNTGERRKAKFIPAGMDPVDTKDKALKDDFDEWLARTFCYALGRSPTPFIKQVNRATAAEQAEAEKREGNMPYMRWMKNRVDFIMAKYQDAPDCELYWVENKDANPLVQAQVDEIYINTEVQQPQQIAQLRGFEWMAPPEPEVLPGKTTEQVTAAGKAEAGADSTGTSPQSAQSAQSKTGEKATAKKLEKTAGKKKKKRLDPVPLERPATKKAVRKLKKIVGKFLPAVGEQIAGKLGHAYAALGKAAKQKTPLDDAIDDLDMSGWTILWEPVADQLTAVYEDSALESLAQVGITDEDITDLVMDEAVDWAKSRAAEMVGMKYDPTTGELTENPNPKWAITDSTRDMLRDTIANSLEEGPTVQTLAASIEDSAAFSADRAELIARTEIATAHNQGCLEGYRQAQAAGVAVMKKWLDSDGCDECSENADAGPIDLDDTFPSGDDCPPAHPNCRCAISPVVPSAEDVEDEGEPYK